MSDLKIFTDNIEPTALNQIYTLVKQPAFADCKVRIMPDVHAGAGCVIGFTIDESPMAYKTMEEIIANIADTVEVVNIIKPVYNFKASE